MPSTATGSNQAFLPALFDTHCHLDLPAFDGDRSEVVARARAAGVQGVLIPAIRPATWTALVALPASHPRLPMVLALGVHPQIVPQLAPDERRLAEDPNRLAEAVRTAGAVAVGECGLDGGTEDRLGQERIFRAHLRAARELGLPVVVHVLRAHDTAARILREERVADVGGVMHSYSGGAGLLPVYRDLGLHFSFAGPITFPGARRPLEAARAVPDELLLVETDAPDQAPEPHRNTRCEPASLRAVVQGLAQVRGTAPDELAALTARNAHRLFRIPSP